MVKKGKTQRRNKVPGWPRRPLSAYNIYFKVQRILIINNESGIQNVNAFDAILKDSVGSTCLGCDAGTGKKRLHRTSHGKIGFADLARTISRRWNVCDAETKAYFESHALVEKRRYAEELNVFRSNLSKKTVKEESQESDREPVERAEKPDTTRCKVRNANESCTNKDLANVIHSSTRGNSPSCSESLEPLPLRQIVPTSFIGLDQETCDYVVMALGRAQKF